MTDSLGQSQVIPYLVGLVKEGHEVHILSCEKEEAFKANQDGIQMLLFKNGIHWHPVKYTKFPPVLSTLKDVRKLNMKAKRLQYRLNFDAVHCRSYIAALIGLKLKKKYDLKFIFDIRGFWADERVDGGLWDLSKKTYRRIYDYFKNKEKEFFENADAIVTLTNASRNYIQENFSHNCSITVIPCAADLDLFIPQTEEIKRSMKTGLGLKDEFVLLYLGSIGTWYLLPEMLDFFLALKEVKPDAKFVFITGDDAQEIQKVAAEKGVVSEDIIVKKSQREDVPGYISIADLSVFFIKPCFSKMASSPTKHGELLACNVPVICNEIGDLKEILDQQNVGACINEFSNEAYKKALHRALAIVPNKTMTSLAEKHYSLKQGTKRYCSVYDSLVS